jgi:hypothetical protein
MDNIPKNIESEYKRAILRQVVGYREICKNVRSSGGGSLFWGALMLFLWYIAFLNQGRETEPIAIMHLVLGVSEILVGLWKLLAPSPECILVDGIILLGFAAVNGYRIFDAMQNNEKPWTGSIVFGIMMLISGVQHIRQYFDIRRSLIERPTREHLRYFEDLLKDVRAADPESDPNALDLPTRPAMRAKLLGDNAMFVTKAGDVIIAAVDEVDLHIVKKEETGELEGQLTILNVDFGWCDLTSHNVKNYQAWKAAYTS